MTDLGRQLDETADPSFKDWVLFEGEMLAQSWSGLVDSVRTGKTAPSCAATAAIAMP